MSGCICVRSDLKYEKLLTATEQVYRHESYDNPTAAYLACASSR